MKVMMHLTIFFGFVLPVTVVLADSHENPGKLTEAQSISLHDAAMDILSSAKCRNNFRDYLKVTSNPKAFAYTVDPRGYYGHCEISIQAPLINAEKLALQSCNQKRNNSEYIKKFSPQCKLFASNNQLLVSMKDFNLKPHKVDLLFAAERKSLPVVRKLVEEGADIHHTNKFGSTALLKAAQEGRKDIVEYLLEQGADIQHKQDRGFDALNISALHGDSEMFEVLLSKGANINTTAETAEKMPIHYAASGNHHKLLEFLLSKKVDINQPDKFNITPLHYAVDGTHLNMVKLLVKNGADIHAKTKTGKTPLDYTKRKKKLEIAKYLKSQGAAKKQLKFKLN